MSTLEAFLESREKDGVWAFNRRWRDCPFYGIYLRREDGTEIPSLISNDDFQMMTAGPNPEAAENVINAWQPPEGTQIVIKEKPFHAWCRDCLHNGVLLNWLGEEAVMNQTILRLIGYTAVRDGAEGRPFLTECDPLKTDEDTSRFKAQKWLQAGIDPDLKERDESVEESLVYDSTKDALFTNANLEQRCRETLSAEEQALYDQWCEMPVDFAELLGVDPKTLRRDASDVEAELSFQPGEHEPVAPDGTPESIDKLLKLEKAIAERFLGRACDLKLELKPWEDPDAAQGLVESSEDALPETEGAVETPATSVNIVFGNYPQFALMIAGEVIDDECLEAAGMPTETGLHPLPDGFYQRLARHISCLVYWSNIVQPDTSNFYPLQDGLTGLFPRPIFNRDEMFVPDYRDSAFPRFGRWQYSTGEVPLLVLGRKDGYYICNIMAEVEIPGDDIPASFPGRSDFVDQGQATFLEFIECLAIPEDLVEFPDDWLAKDEPDTKTLVNGLSRDLMQSFVVRTPPGQTEFCLEVARRMMARINQSEPEKEESGFAWLFMLIVFTLVALPFVFG